MSLTVDEVLESPLRPEADLDALAGRVATLARRHPVYPESQA